MIKQEKPQHNVHQKANNVFFPYVLLFSNPLEFKKNVHVNGALHWKYVIYVQCQSKVKERERYWEWKKNTSNLTWQRFELDQY